jgi:hypothetical protein
MLQAVTIQRDMTAASADTGSNSNHSDQLGSNHSIKSRTKEIIDISDISDVDEAESSFANADDFEWE